ncbi:thrombomodulin [Eublepharis macularius]|uniref:Thrombomodulin n=1 Tax=Eublepharis macularius TaxID=481883 RepID=A0AA97JQZ9_EUBMA|nr:thrombomodulin [Eublepharis macularius]
MGPLELLLLALAAVGPAQGAGLPPSTTPPASSSAQCLDSSCFGLFWEARSFPEAESACQASGGRLMRARSTVAAEAIELLRRGRAGGVWLGLRLPEGRCVEPGRALRGFQWVAGDERTDYEAWAGGWPAAGGCGPRCVVVNAALRWEDRACQAAATGFLCEYSYPGGTCGPLALPPGTAASYTTPFGVRDGDLSAFPPGTTAEVPGLDAPLECQARANGSAGWGAAAPGAWHCQLERGGCEGQCQEDELGRPFCTCSEGTALRPDGRGCLSPCAELRCQHQCVPQGDHGLCMCQEGYELDADGRSCLDVDDCAAHPGPCEQECLNTAGGFRCRCFAGYTLVDGRCLRNEALCFHLSCQHECVVVDGTSRCACFEGFAPDPKDPQLCVRFCNSSECPAQCDPHTPKSCYCPEGYIIHENEDGAKICRDINECEEGYCDWACRNWFGGYECFCPPGQRCEGATTGPLDEGSGDETLRPTQTPVITSGPPRDRRSPGTLVAIIVSTALSLVALAAVVWCFLKKPCVSRTRMDYKCQQLQTEVVMGQVRQESASYKQKM